MKDVCAAYCSLAEIYLSDLWYVWENTVSMHENCLDNHHFAAVCSRSCSMEEGASDKCRECIERAIQYHSDSPEALQLMASYLFSTERNQVSKYTHVHVHTHKGLHAHMHTEWVITTLKRESAELIILSKLNCMPLINRWTRALTLTHTQTGHAGRNVNYLPYHLGHTFIW